MNKIKSGVYAVTCLANKKMYIGQSKNCKKRLGKHRYDFKNNRNACGDMQKDYNIYGKDMFTYSVLEFTEDYIKRESDWIRHFRATESEFGYNKYIPDEGKQYGKERNQIISPNMRAIIAINIITKEVIECESLYRFAKEKKLRYNRLQECIYYWDEKKGKKSYFNWIIVYKDIYNPDFDYIGYQKPKKEKKVKEKKYTPMNERNYARKQIKITNIETGKERIFQCRAELIKELGMVKSKVDSCLAGKFKQHKGYRIEFTGQRGIAPAFV